MSSPSPELEKQFSFAVALTVYSNLKKKTKGKASAAKEVKSVKTKELLFPLRDNNYLGFLQSLLEKHGQDQYIVSDRRWYPFKFVPPKAKGQCATDAMDVDNKADYQEMVGKIHGANPSVTKIFIDMKHIEKLPSNESSNEASEASGDDDDLKTPTHGAADLDTCLARWCIKLQRLHKNEHDEGFTYIGPMGPLALTLAMILDWCWALEEGQATLHTPPNIESFNVANKATHLHPTCKAQAPAQPPTTPVDLNALTSVLLLQTLTKSSVLSSPTPSTPHLGSIPPPVTPTRVVQGAAENPSPPVPSPTQLSHFLCHAETNLGVHNATQFEESLELQGIGPDILAEVDNKVLTDAGISISNIIRLKRGCMAWWNSADAKQKHSNTEVSVHSTDLPTHPPKRRVAYEK
ncbi:hypothetical protein PISMIDRAFT_18143 [Pisolithus microcarpus 441]|uniref:SAM domain-containing protein n=1 Tax=Pisolithus microcarpus 441 TaxID=765257 RepID=A0A0C9YSB6_9AGAM|nr:hypothetical protein BKA83DRAFT_18143 [Pisolithus microcarpus]KIK13212.1 hypothetical protein PISMIDRAFT_18143 [Pisolithus microcarpus 441]